MVIVCSLFALLMINCKANDKIGCIALITTPSPCRDSIDFTIDEYPLGQQWLSLDSMNPGTFKFFNNISGDSILFEPPRISEYYNRKKYSTYPYTSINACFDGIPCPLLFSSNSKHLSYHNYYDLPFRFSFTINTEREVNKYIYDKYPPNWKEYLEFNFNNISIFKYRPNDLTGIFDKYEIIPTITFGKKTYQNVIHVYDMSNSTHQNLEALGVYFHSSYGLLSIDLDNGESWSVK